MFEQFAGFTGQRHGEIFRVVKLIPVAFLGKRFDAFAQVPQGFRTMGGEGHRVSRVRRLSGKARILSCYRKSRRLNGIIIQ